MQVIKPLVALLLLASVAGCSSSKPEEPKELKDPDQKESISISLDTPEQNLLADAKRYFDSEMYSLAKENFMALRAGYPNSQWVEFADIKIADCLFELTEYAEASKAYEGFVKNRPTSDATSYMLFRAARSNQLSYKGVGRDPAPLNKALEQYNQLISDFPDTPYTESGKKFRSEVVDSLVAQEKKIQRFYEKQNRPEAVAAREQRINQQWVPVMQQTRYNAPTAGSVAPEGITAPQHVAADVNIPHGEPVETVSASGRVLKIECSTGNTNGVFIFFDREIPLLAAYKRSQHLPAANGVLALDLPGVITPEQTSDCFGKNDLKLSSSGTFSLASAKPATVMSLSNPARLFISVK